MNTDGSIVQVHAFVALTVAIIVLFLGAALNQRFEILRRINISDSVTGGLAISILLALVYFLFGLEFKFDLTIRDHLAVYFFTAIGINTRLRDLVAARRPVMILFAATVFLMVAQDIIAIVMATVVGDPGPKALLAGTVALSGGYETVNEWAPKFVNDFGVADAQQIGISSATLGLVLGSLLGGPIAYYLSREHGLERAPAAEGDEAPGVPQTGGSISSSSFLQSVLAIHICIIVAIALKPLLGDAGYDLPLPFTGFVAAIVLTNLVPVLVPRLPWPSRTPAMSLIAELSLGTLFGMSLISAQLWVVFDLPIELAAIVFVQVAVTAAMTIFVLFRILGRNHDAAVICSGFVGFALGSTFTAMANMKAAARQIGTAHIGFIIVPLVTVTCFDAVNKVLIHLLLALF